MLQLNRDNQVSSTRSRTTIISLLLDYLIQFEIVGRGSQGSWRVVYRGASSRFHPRPGHPARTLKPCEVQILRDSCSHPKNWNLDDGEALMALIILGSLTHLALGSPRG